MGGRAIIQLESDCSVHGCISPWTLVRHRRFVVAVIVIVLSPILPSHPLSNHPLRPFDVPAPCLHKSGHLRALDDAVVPRPADPHIDPPLTFPVFALVIRRPP